MQYTSIYIFNNLIMHYQILHEQEQFALQLRSERKHKLREKQTRKPSIIFPHMHIPEDNELLRYGMSRLYNGFMIHTGECGLLVDPGVDFMYRWLCSWYQVSDIDGIFASHQHIDHMGGMPVVLEWLLRAGKMVDILLTPESIADSAIPSYYLGTHPERANHRIRYLDREEWIDLVYMKIQTISHFHGIACYGLSTIVAGKKITHISDTGYATLVSDEEWNKIPGKEKIIWRPEILEKHESIRNAVHGSDVAIINMDALDYRSVSETHMSARDIIDMVKNNNVWQLIITHINPVWQYSKEWIEWLRGFIEEESGVKVMIPGKEWFEVFI